MFLKCINILSFLAGLVAFFLIPDVKKVQFKIALVPIALGLLMYPMLTFVPKGNIGISVADIWSKPYVESYDGGINFKLLINSPVYTIPTRVEKELELKVDATSKDDQVVSLTLGCDYVFYKDGSKFLSLIANNHEFLASLSKEDRRKLLDCKFEEVLIVPMLQKEIRDILKEDISNRTLEELSASPTQWLSEVASIVDKELGEYGVGISNVKLLETPPINILTIPDDREAEDNGAIGKSSKNLFAIKVQCA